MHISEKHSAETFFKSGEDFQQWGMFPKHTALGDYIGVGGRASACPRDKNFPHENGGWLDRSVLCLLSVVTGVPLKNQHFLEIQAFVSAIPRPKSIHL